MFCNACGAKLEPQFKVCPNCGRPVDGPGGAVTGSATAVASFSQPSRLERHLRTLGILWIVVGILFMIPAIAMTILSGVVHIAIPATAEVGRYVGPLVMSIIGGSLFILAAGGVLVGWGLMNRQSWARIVAVILGILALFHPPFGTALGIYTLWVLLSDQAGEEYNRLARVS